MLQVWPENDNQSINIIIKPWFNGQYIHRIIEITNIHKVGICFVFVSSEP